MRKRRLAVVAFGLYVYVVWSLSGFCLPNFGWLDREAAIQDALRRDLSYQTKNVEAAMRLIPVSCCEVSDDPGYFIFPTLEALIYRKLYSVILNYDVTVEGVRLHSEFGTYIVDCCGNVGPKE